MSDAGPPHHRDAPETGAPSSQAETAEQALEPIETPARAEDAQASQTRSAMAASTTTSQPERIGRASCRERV